MSGADDNLAHDADDLGYQLGRLQRVRERTVHQLGWRGADGLEMAAYRCVFAVLELGPMRSGALAEAVLADPSTVSRHVAQLVALGHLERRPDPADGRATVIAATAAGRAAAGRMRARRNERLATVIGDWPRQDRQELVRLMTRLLDDYELRREDLLAEALDRVGQGAVEP
ncbi:MarR family winged helix-turn-helix transcriptional regulator [Tomitella biformata]|uniref:MarR family winged helix-turn-helix transcriptional regulator n=1 Tax=Tomitella biformata TaxID=630403 RepID=UPI000466D587|nr:MarR family winged helix-turn-helix transcriptional regulator [Tomitella biformata]